MADQVASLEMSMLAFIPAQPFSWTRRNDLGGRHSRTSILRRSHCRTTRPCHRKPAMSSEPTTEVPTTPTADGEAADSEISAEETSNAVMFDPSAAPSLLRKPESVIAIVTLGFLSTIAFLVSSARRITSDVAARANYVMGTRRLEARLRARVRERNFLKSAVEATYATLDNTTSYLEAQRRRVTIAEETLERLESQRHDLQQAEQRRNELVQLVTTAERDLTAEKRMAVNDEDTLRQMQDSVATHRSNLASFEQNLQSASEQLQHEQQKEHTDLIATRANIETLENELSKTTRVLNDALKMKDQLDSTCSDAESRADTLHATVRNTLSDVEDHRRMIDNMTQRAESVKRDIQRKRKDTLSARDDAAPNDNMESVITDINSQKKDAEFSLAELDTRQTDLAREKHDLLDQLSTKDESLHILREQLANLEKLAMPSEASDELSARATEDGLLTERQDIHMDDKIKSKQSEATPPSRRKHTRESPSKSVEVIDQTQANQNRTKPRRGRPRKTVAAIDEDMKQGGKPRKKRGRPRKKAPAQPISQ